jgi:large subunit ribosomal protein L41
MTSKMGNKHYYKGSGTGSMGSLTSKGAFVPDPEKRRVLVTPETLFSTQVWRLYLCLH